MKVLVLLLLMSGPILVLGTKPSLLTIGVVTQKEWWPNNKGNHYISTIYVKYLETNGALVVPILTGKSSDYYDKIMSKINGLLLPDGFNSLVDTSYARTVPKLMDRAIALNRKGVNFPVWGISYGFEQLIIYFTKSTKWINRCEVINQTVSTELTNLHDEFRSRLFANSDNILKILSSENVSVHDHHFCLTVSDFYKFKLNQNFTILGSNKFCNISAVSIIESKQYPIFGTSFKPEEDQLIIRNNLKFIDRGPNAILIAQHFVNYFLNEARKNRQHFPTKQEEMDSLVYNFRYARVFTGRGQNTYFDKIYQFSGYYDSNTLSWSTVLVAIVTLLVTNLYHH